MNTMLIVIAVCTLGKPPSEDNCHGNMQLHIPVAADAGFDANALYCRRLSRVLVVEFDKKLKEQNVETWVRKERSCTRYVGYGA